MNNRIKIIVIASIIMCGLFFAYARPADAGGGNLIKLKGIAEKAAAKGEVSKGEEINYQKAKEFINSKDISPGVSSDSVLQICGEPVARAQDGKKWVYKPPSSTFFKGEKIYFFFDESNKLASWEQVSQK